MYLKSVISPGPQPNFLNLSLFICQLFAGGDFKMGQILYHPEAFNDQFYSEIKTDCHLEIPTMTVDISASETYSFDQNQRTVHILQLICVPHV